MGSKKFLLFFLFLHAVTVPAQTDSAPPAWFAQAYGFIARYHLAIDYKTGLGAGLSVGRSIHKNWLSLAAGFEYTRAMQELRLINGLYETRADLYCSFLALRGNWFIKKRTVMLFASLLGGASFFQPQPLMIDAGVLGKITLRTNGETKFITAWESGLTFHLGENIAVLFSIKQYYSRFAGNQIGVEQPEDKWRPYWNFATGLSYHF
jgi:hypothetical protein